MNTQVTSQTARRAVPGQPVDFSTLASDLFFGKGFTVAAALLEYRKGKTIEDVHAARAKALRHGHAKVEHELSMLEVYLKSVFKSRHASPKTKMTTP